MNVAATKARRVGRNVSIGTTLRIETRLRDLPARCEMLAAGLDNLADDPTLVFAGLPYGPVALLALRHRAVRAAITKLPSNFEWVSD